MEWAPKLNLCASLGIQSLVLNAARDLSDLTVLFTLLCLSFNLNCESQQFLQPPLSKSCKSLSNSWEVVLSIFNTRHITKYKVGT